MTAHDPAELRPSGMGLGTRRRMLMWLMLSVLTALVVYFGFRGYLTPELLFQFVSGLHC
jgi:cytochrome c oxidase subunit IV